MTKTSVRIAALAAMIHVFAHTAPAQTPLGTAFTYQGQLNQAGQPFNGPADLLFDLYDADVGGNLLGSQTLNGVAVSAGLFTVQLNAAGEFGASAFTGEQRWLEISVNGTPLAPRQELTATPHALFALDSDLLDGLDSTAFLQSIPNPLSLTGAGNPVISGVTTSTAVGATGVYGEASASTSGFGVYGQSDSIFGRGVFGWATAASGTTFGVGGETASTGGRAVDGYATAATGITYGGRFESDSTSGRAVFGYANAATGTTYGGRFESDSTNGRAVFGYATAAAGTTYGVYGQSESTVGRGVYGRAAATTGTNSGVYGESDSTSGRGVEGRATVAGSNYGVYGVDGGSSNYGVYASGDMGASGLKPFRIDHPDDPENQYLLHYAAESPEVINFYSDTVTLDERGETVVELPHYFAKINTDPRYTLTAVGAPMPMLHVAEEIDEAALSAGAEAEPGEAAPVCSFRIAGGVPGGKVCWRVEAVRNDLRMRLHGAPVERDKEGPERGKYQHPEYYNLPSEMGMNYDAERERRSDDRPSLATAPDATRQK